MDDVVRVGQAGLGYWGPNVLRNMNTVPGAKVVAVADLDPRRLKGAQYTGIVTLPDAGALIDDPEIDAIVIATPAASHFTLALRALEAGKHVLVEKPLAMTADESQRLTDVAERVGRTLMVAHTFLYNAAVGRLKQCVTSGDVGNVFYVHAQRLNLGRVRQDVNALWNFAPHDISILIYLFDAMPVEVTARGFAYLQPNIDDVVFMTLEFPGGIGAHVHLSWLDPHKIRRMTVVGSRKMVAYDDTSPDAKIVIYDRGVDRIPNASSPRDFESFAEFQLTLRTGDVIAPALKFPEPLKLQCEHFIECIRERRTPLTDGRHGTAVVRVLEAAQESLGNRGRPVSISR